MRAGIVVNDSRRLDRGGFRLVSLYAMCLRQIVCYTRKNVSSS